jgi:hypothetical protein
MASIFSRSTIMPSSETSSPNDGSSLGKKNTCLAFHIVDVFDPDPDYFRHEMRVEI